MVPKHCDPGVLLLQGEIETEGMTISVLTESQ